MPGNVAFGQSNAAQDDAHLNENTEHHIQHELWEAHAEQPGDTDEEGCSCLTPVPAAGSVPLVLFEEIAHEGIPPKGRTEMGQQPGGEPRWDAVRHTTPPFKAGRSALSLRSVA